MSWKLYYANPDGSNEQSVNLEALGALEGGLVTGDGIQFKFSSHKASELNLKIPNVDPKNAPKISAFGRVRLLDGNGVQQFVGRRIDWDGSVSADRKGFSYQFQDAWWDLTKITFKDLWFSGGYLPVTVSGSMVTFSGGVSVVMSGQMPTAQFYDANKNPIGTDFNVAVASSPATSFTISGGVGTAAGAMFVAFVNLNTDVVLFQYRPGDPYQNASEVMNYYITTGEQIVEILNFAISRGVLLQIGTIDPSLFVPWYPVRCQNCAECIKVCLRDHPDCFTEIDYSTTPPTFHVRQRSNLLAKTLPYAYTDGNGIQHVSTDVKPRPDLIPARIGIFYRYLINGSVVAFPQDIWPVNAPDGLLAMDYSIDLQGPRTSASFGAIASLPFDPTVLTLSDRNNFWLRKHPQFQNNTTIDPTYGEIANLVMCDATGAAGTGGLTVFATGTNTPVDYTAGHFAFEMIGGGQALWMTGIQAQAVTVSSWFKYDQLHTNPNGSVSAADPTKNSAGINTHLVSVNVTLVNTASIQQAFYAYLTSGEAIPANLAHSIWSSLQTMQYNLRQSSREEPFTGFIKPGKHCINLAGGNGDWTNMQATVQESTYTLRQRPDGVVWAMSDVSCGPVEHLEAGQLVQLFNIFANRNLSNIDPWERITGQTSAGGGGAAVSTTTENTTLGIPFQGMQGFQGLTPATIGGTAYYTRVNIDATASGIVVQKVDITGAPAASTVAAPGYSMLLSDISSILTAGAITPVAGATVYDVWNPKFTEVKLCDDAGNFFYAVVLIGGGYTKS